MENMEDAKLVRMSNDGDEQATITLLKRYEKILRYKSHKYKVRGYTDEDLFQEGRIGFLKAIERYEEGTAKFNTFFTTVVRRELLKLIQHSKAEKRDNNKAVSSLDFEIGEKGEVLIDIIEDSDSEKDFNETILADRLKRIEELVEPEQWKIRVMMSEGYSRAEVADHLGITTNKIRSMLNSLNTRLKNLGLKGVS